MKYSKRLLCLLLSLAMLLSLSAVPVHAAEALETGSATYTNPLYPDVSIPDSISEDAETDDSASITAPRTQSGGFLSIEDAAAELRDQMRTRTTVFTIPVYAPGYTADKPSVTRLVNRVLMPMAYSEDLAVDINSGDYLRWSWAKVRYTWTSSVDSYLEITMYFTYYSTANDEVWLISHVKSVVDELDLWSSSDYQKYCGIYDYITDHVDYDYDGLKSGNVYIYTAYAALHNGKAVCQGYATLFYAMCRAMGLPVRIITSSDHAWNIVKLGDLWYNMDATWDGSSDVSTHNYLLKGSEAFQDHTASKEYLTSEFTAAYPLSQTDYVPTEADSQPVCPFRDVASDAYYFDAVQEMTARKFINGTSNYTFSPNLTTDRAMLVTVLWRLAGEPEATQPSVFTDVSSDDYFAKSVAWAYETGITNGISATAFGPYKQLLRQELATFLYRYAQVMGYATSAYNSLSKFTDRSSIDSYALPAVRWAVGAKIINGVEAGTIAPYANAPRCQMATMLYRFIAYYGL